MCSEGQEIKTVQGKQGGTSRLIKGLRLSIRLLRTLQHASGTAFQYPENFN